MKWLKVVICLLCISNIINALGGMVQDVIFRRHREASSKTEFQLHQLQAFSKDLSFRVEALEAAASETPLRSSRLAGDGDGLPSAGLSGDLSSEQKQSARQLKPPATISK